MRMPGFRVHQEVKNTLRITAIVAGIVFHCWAMANSGVLLCWFYQAKLREF